MKCFRPIVFQNMNRGSGQYVEAERIRHGRFQNDAGVMEDQTVLLVRCPLKPESIHPEWRLKWDSPKFETVRFSFSPDCPGRRAESPVPGIFQHPFRLDFSADCFRIQFNGSGPGPKMDEIGFLPFSQPSLFLFDRVDDQSLVRLVDRISSALLRQKILAERPEGPERFCGVLLFNTQLKRAQSQKEIPFCLPVVTDAECKNPDGRVHEMILLILAGSPCDFEMFRSNFPFCGNCAVLVFKALRRDCADLIVSVPDPKIESGNRRIQIGFKTGCCIDGFISADYRRAFQ